MLSRVGILAVHGQEDVNAHALPRWDAHLAATSAVVDHQDAVAWLGNRLAAALRSHIEADRAATWNPELTPPTTRLAAWLVHAYGYTTPAAAADGGEMPLIGQWLSDRAYRLAAAPLLIASPAAGAVAVAAAQALTAADVAALTASAWPAQELTQAHLTLSAPITVTADSQGAEGETIQALTWWPDAPGVRVVDWISTYDTLTSDEVNQATAAARSYSAASLPALMLNTERLHTPASAPDTMDPHPTEGQFTFDAPVVDPDGDLAARVALAVRHLVETGLLSTSIERVRPTGATGHVTRTPVVVLRTRDDDAHTDHLAHQGTSVAMQRQWQGSDLQWRNPILM